MGGIIPESDDKARDAVLANALGDVLGRAFQEAESMKGTKLLILSASSSFCDAVNGHSAENMKFYRRAKKFDSYKADLIAQEDSARFHDDKVLERSFAARVIPRA